MVIRSFSPDEDRTPVTSARRFLSAVLMGAAAVLLSCGEPAPTAPAVVVPPLEASIDYSSNGLLHCRPLAYDSVTKTIGPKGGSIRVSKHVLVIPDLALSQPVTITMVAPSDTLNRIQVQPEGLVFRPTAKRTTLTLSYANCDIGPSARQKRIAYTNDSLAILEYVRSVDDPSQRKVTGVVHHFSEYAIAW